MTSERSRLITPFSTGPQRRGQVMPQLASFPKMPFQANSAATDVATMQADFNALLAKLVAAGLMASS